ncbi:hypothetical protein AB0N03_37265, partial [Amycolatopsis sp. NPDC051061]
MFESGDGPVHPPADLQKFLKVTLGMAWPEGNVRSMRAMSQAWADIGPVAADFAENVRARAGDLDRAMDGEYAEAMAQWLNGSVASALDQVEGYAEQLSAALRNSAADVEKAQILIIVAATFALTQVIILLASLIFAWMAPAVEAAAQVTLRMIMQQLISKLASLSLEKLSMEAVKQLLLRIAPWVQSTVIDLGVSAGVGAGVMAAADYFTQLGQHNNHQRDHIDGRSVWQAAVGGAIGGAASGLMTSGARGVVYAAKSAAAQFGKKIPPGLVVLGQVGYAAGQAASVAWSNPIINKVLHNPDAFWGGVLGGLSSFGRPHLPDRSGGEGGMKIDVPNLDLTLPPGAEKPASPGAGEHGNPPKLVIPADGDTQGTPGGDQVTAPAAQTPATVSGQSPDTSGSRTPAAGALNGHAPTTTADQAPVMDTTGRAPAGGTSGAETSGTGQAPPTGTAGTQSPATQIGTGEQPVVTQQPVTSGGTQLGQLFTPGTAQPATEAAPGAAGDARPSTSTQPGATGQPSADSAARPVTSTTGQPSGPVSAGGDGRPATSAQPGPAAGQPSVDGVGRPGSVSPAGDARPSTNAQPGSVAGQPSAAGAGSPGQDGHPATNTSGQPGPAVGQPSGDAVGRPASSGGDARPGTGAVGQPSAPAGSPSVEARPGTNPAGTGANTSGQPGPAVGQPTAEPGGRPASPAPATGSPAERPGSAPAGGGDGRPATSTAGQAPAERPAAGGAGPQPVARPVPPGGGPGQLGGDARPAPAADPQPNRAPAEPPARRAPGYTTPPQPVTAGASGDGPRPSGGDTARPGGSEGVRPGSTPAQPAPATSGQPGGDGPRPNTGHPAGSEGARPGSTPAQPERTAAGDPARPGGGDGARPVTGDPARPGSGQPAPQPERPGGHDAGGRQAGPPAQQIPRGDGSVRSDAAHRPGESQSAPAAHEVEPRRDSLFDPADAQAAVVAAQLATSRPDQPGHDGGGRAPAAPPAAADWSAVRDSVPATRHRGERVASGGTAVSPLRFDVRRGQVAPNQWVRELSVPVDLVSSSGRVDAGARRALAEGVQRLLHERVNGRHRFGDGARLHVVVDAATPNGPPRPGWAHDGSRRVPVEVDEAARDGQLTWRPDDLDAAVGKLLSLVGADGSGRLGAPDLAAIDAAIRDTRAEVHPVPPAPQRPTVVADPSGGVVWPKRLPGLGTAWTRGADGWYRAEAPGVLERGGERTVVPEGALAVFDAGGDVRHVVLGDGVSFERGLDGGWSPPRTQSGEVRARKTDAAEPLYRPDGSLLVELPPESEKVADRHGDAEKVVAYRQLKDDAGKWLPQPRVFVPGEGGGWTEHGTGAVAYEGWLAGANQAHDAARTLWDIAARSGPEVPENRKLTNISDAELARLYSRGSEADAFAAVFELIRRSKGIALRWTQVSAVHAFGKGQVVNMAAGEGKSWLFFAHAAVNAARPDVDGVQVTTTRGNLADRELPHYQELMSVLGIDVHRLDPDKPPPGPRDGRPTVYLGTAEDVGFTYLRHETLPGQKNAGDPTVLTVSIDEIDEALVYSNSSYILSEGVQGEASPEVRGQAEWAHDLVRDGMDSGWLDEADFGRREGQAGGPARLIPPGREKVELLLGRPLTGEEVSRIDMAAAAQWEYRENVHYVQHEGKIYIIDQTTHNVLFNPETSSESRWNGGLAQAVEFKHGLEIRSDSASSKSVTAHELLSKEEYGQKTGASGTANGHGDQFAGKGMSAVVEDMPRYYESRLNKSADVVAADEAAKLAQLARDVQAMQSPEGTRQPQLILATRNDQVAAVSGLLSDLGVAHEAIDAKWQLEQGKNLDEAFKAIIDAAGAPGKVLVINMQGARGVDITTSPEAKARGDLMVRVTAHSEISADIDVQAENRAGRSGGGGEVVYYSSPKDEIYQLSRHPDVQQVVIKYADALAEEDAPALAIAEQRLRDLVAPLQPNSGHPVVDLGAASPNAPPAGRDTGTGIAEGRPETRPPARPNAEPVQLTYHEGLAGALNAAERDFAGQLAQWRAANPGVVLPGRDVERIRDEFVAGRGAGFEDQFGSLRSGPGARQDVRAAWQAWLDQPAGASVNMAEWFTHAALHAGWPAEASAPADGTGPDGAVQGIAGDGMVLAEDGAIADAGGMSTGQLPPGTAGSLPADVVRQWERARDVLGSSKLPADVADGLVARARQLLSDAYQT